MFKRHEGSEQIEIGKTVNHFKGAELFKREASQKIVILDEFKQKFFPLVQESAVINTCIFREII